MSTNQTKAVVKQARIHCPQELEHRQLLAVNKLMEGHYIDTLSGGYYSHPAAITETFNNVDSFLDYIAAQAVAGTERYPHISPILNPTCMQVTHYKPKEELDVLIQEVKEKATQAYKDEIQSWNQAQVELLTQQLIASELAKEEKKELDKLEAIKAKALKTATDHIQSQLQGAN